MSSHSRTPPELNPSAHTFTPSYSLSYPPSSLPQPSSSSNNKSNKRKASGLLASAASKFIRPGSAKGQKLPDNSPGSKTKANVKTPPLPKIHVKDGRYVPSPSTRGPLSAGSSCTSPTDKPLPSLPVATIVEKSAIQRRSLIDATERPLHRGASLPQPCQGPVVPNQPVAEHPLVGEEWPALSPYRPALGQYGQRPAEAVKPSLGESVIEAMQDLHIGRHDRDDDDDEHEHDHGSSPLLPAQEHTPHLMFKGSSLPRPIGYRNRNTSGHTTPPAAAATADDDEFISGLSCSANAQGSLPRSRSILHHTATGRGSPYAMVAESSSNDNDSNSSVQTTSARLVSVKDVAAAGTAGGKAKTSIPLPTRIMRQPPTADREHGFHVSGPGPALQSRPSYQPGGLMRTCASDDGFTVRKVRCGARHVSSKTPPAQDLTSRSGVSFRAAVTSAQHVDTEAEASSESNADSDNDDTVIKHRRSQDSFLVQHGSLGQSPSSVLDAYHDDNDNDNDDDDDDDKEPAAAPSGTTAPKTPKSASHHDWPFKDEAFNPPPFPAPAATPVSRDRPPSSGCASSKSSWTPPAFGFGNGNAFQANSSNVDLPSSSRVHTRVTAPPVPSFPARSHFSTPTPPVLASRRPSSTEPAVIEHTDYRRAHTHGFAYSYHRGSDYYHHPHCDEKGARVENDDVPPPTPEKDEIFRQPNVGGLSPAAFPPRTSSRTTTATAVTAPEFAPPFVTAASPGTSTGSIYNANPNLPPNATTNAQLSPIRERSERTLKSILGRPDSQDTMQFFAHPIAPVAGAAGDTATDASKGTTSKSSTNMVSALRSLFHKKSSDLRAGTGAGAGSIRRRNRAHAHGHANARQDGFTPPPVPIIVTTPPNTSTHHDNSSSFEAGGRATPIPGPGVVAPSNTPVKDNNDSVKNGKHQILKAAARTTATTTSTGNTTPTVAAGATDAETQTAAGASLEEAAHLLGLAVAAAHDAENALIDARLAVSRCETHFERTAAVLNQLREKPWALE